MRLGAAVGVGARTWLQTAASTLVGENLSALNADSDTQTPGRLVGTAARGAAPTASKLCRQARSSDTEPQGTNSEDHGEKKSRQSRCRSPRRGSRHAPITSSPGN